MNDWCIEHSAKGSTWKDHKYLRKARIKGTLRYIYNTTSGSSTQMARVSNRVGVKKNTSKQLLKSSLNRPVARMNASKQSLKRAINVTGMSQISNKIPSVTQKLSSVVSDSSTMQQLKKSINVTGMSRIKMSSELSKSLEKTGMSAISQVLSPAINKRKPQMLKS